MESPNTRTFTVKGNLECGFTPDQSTTYETVSNLDVELWHKSPLDVIYLGTGKTNENGDFTVTFEVDGTPDYMEDGKIKDVFMKVYYKGTLISGENPYEFKDLELKILVPYETNDNSASIVIVPNSTGTVDNIHSSLTNLTYEKNNSPISLPFAVDVGDEIEFFFDTATEDGNIIMEGKY